LSCMYKDRCTFRIHINGVMAIIQNTKAMRSARNHARLSIFLPLACDLILEASRTVCYTNDTVLEFFYVAQRAIGKLDFDNRLQYCQELICVKEQHLYTFYHSIWHHTTILRRCIRDTVWRQDTDAEVGLSPRVRSLLIGVKSDLRSKKVKSIVAQLSILKSVPAGENEVVHGEWMFALLLYKFCLLMVALLETGFLIHGVSSAAVVSRASGLLQYVDHTWLQHDQYIACNLGVPSYIRKAIVVRVLLLVGLTIHPEIFPHGNLISTSELICHDRIQIDHYPA
jgi:hypothetical protein